MYKSAFITANSNRECASRVSLSTLFILYKEQIKNSAEARIDTGFGAFFQQFRNPFYFDCFGEALRLAKEKMDQKNVYYLNPSFDR